MAELAKQDTIVLNANSIMSNDCMLVQVLYTTDFYMLHQA